MTIPLEQPQGPFISRSELSNMENTDAQFVMKICICWWGSCDASDSLLKAATLTLLWHCFHSSCFHRLRNPSFNVDEKSLKWTENRETSTSPNPSINPVTQTPSAEEDHVTRSKRHKTQVMTLICTHVLKHPHIIHTASYQLKSLHTSIASMHPDDLRGDSCIRNTLYMLSGTL